MELIYCFLGNIDDEELSLSFSFSEKFEIEYNVKTKKIKISKRKSKIPEDFYSNKVSNLNVILGKNGSRKTTLLNLLGTTQYDRRRKFTSKDKWFIIYYNQNNEFVIEGNDLTYIKQFTKVESYSNDYYLTFKYIFEENSIKNIEFIQYNFDKKISSQLNYLYLSRDFEKLNNFYQDDYTLGFKRNYLRSKSYLQEYLFLKDEFPKFQVNIKPLMYSIRLYFDKKKLLENRSHFALNIYGDNNFIFEEKIFKKEIKNNIFNCKESFIINYLEKQIINAWNNKEVLINADELIDSPTINWTKEDLSDIYKLTENSTWITYDDIKLYLKGVLEILVKKIMTINFPGEKVTNSFYLAYLNFINEVEELESEYFISNKEIIIDIINNKFDHDDSKTQNLLRLIDDYKNQYNNKNDLINSLHISPKELSDGQINLVRQFARINTGIKEISKMKYIKNTVLLIDEPELYLHPEWSRKYLNKLLEYINVSRIVGKVHLIITTHSPFLLSDVLGNSVLKIDSRLKGLKVVRGNSGYAMNYYELIKDSFFLDISIGEFAEKKINSIFTNIHNITQDNKSENYQKIKSEINFVGDILIKNNLLEVLNRKMDKKNKETKEVQKLRKKIKDLQIEIKELRE